MAVLLGSCYGAGVLPDGLLLGKVGGNVTFNRASDQPFLTLQMRVNGTAMFNYISNSDIFNPEDGYRDRINLDRSSGSVELMNLVLTDSGQYTVTIVTPEAVSVDENTKLEVYEPISGTTIITFPNTPILEGSSVTLTCDASGSIITREWMKDGQLLSAGGNLIISQDKRVLSINPVKRTDNGHYLCSVSNPVSTADAKYILIVNYGPDGMEIKGPTEIEVGQKFTLTCSADSNPPASYTWMHNETEIPGHSPEFTKEKSEFSDSGNYTCTATNYVTGNKTSEKTLSLGLPAGAITGIVFGLLLVVGVAFGVSNKAIFYHCSL
uniref:Carcinoembryonic antigen-related cell adhesion molecule 1-like n=1 Tax=Salmo trutta TaxID=8032 RepID=A0A674CXN3_SALTR